MKYNFYVPKAFEELIKEHGISKSKAAKFGILAADPNAKWLVLLEGSKRIASTPIFADIKQLERMNDWLTENKFEESYSWYPCRNLDEAYEVWHREIDKGREVTFGIVGWLRNWDYPPIALVTPDEYA